MIKLDIKEYCQACPHFEPVVVKRPENGVGNTIVMCEKRGRCADIYVYLKGVK